MSDRLQLEYQISVTGLGEAAVAANNAARSADQASRAAAGAREQSGSTLPMMIMSVRALNATRLAVEQTSRAITELDPRAAMYGFLNMIQVVRNLSSLMATLRDSTDAASAAQAILATLTGRWWIIPLALAAGAVVYSKIRSMQSGGPVQETGLYMLHRGEYVVPARHLHTYGPIFVSFQRQPREGLDLDEWMGRLGPRIVEHVRRGG